MSTLSENAACIRETTSASTRTSQHKKKKCNFLASLLTLSLIYQNFKKYFLKTQQFCKKHLKKIQKFKIYFKYNSGFPTSSKQKWAALQPFYKPPNISRGVNEVYIHTESDLKCQKFYFIPVRVKIGQNFEVIGFFFP